MKYDHNGDGSVNAMDKIIVILRLTTGLTFLVSGVMVGVVYGIANIFEYLGVTPWVKVFSAGVWLAYMNTGFKMVFNKNFWEPLR